MPPDIAVAREQDVLAGVVERTLVFVGEAHRGLVVPRAEPVAVGARGCVVGDAADER